ncbi:MAG TPA: phenylacetate--CoA ligase [Chloroflexota bacterium]|nr:phenylacetate--CoA ligase [Chloroflexota bacterium]
MFQPDLEALPRRQLAALQLDRLRRTLAQAKRNPAYQRHLGQAADDVRSLESLRDLPFLTKADLRDAYPLDLCTVPRSELVRFHMSSGTTGNPILQPYTVADVRQWGEVMARCLAAATLTAQDTLQITPSFGLFNGGFGFHYGAEALGCFVIPSGPGRTLLQLKLMRELGATALAGIASYAVRLLETAQQEGLDLRSSPLRVGIFGSEMWGDQLRRRIEQGLGIETFDIIGMTETGGVGMGIDCPAHAGIHVWEDHYLVEVVDRDSGEPVPDGQPGELVVTTLTREALPVIRYRTGDITSVIGREPCECGRTGLRLDRFRGRTDDMLIVNGVNFYPKQVEALLLTDACIGNHYQIVLTEDSGLDVVTVECEVTGEPEVEALQRRFLDFVGFRPHFRFHEPGTMDRPEGKAVRVVDRRGR